MTTQVFSLVGEGPDTYIALCDLLKLSGLASSGGQGKLMVAAGLVQVDGQVELRKRAKIRSGQRVSCQGLEIRVVAGETVPGTGA